MRSAASPDGEEGNEEKGSPEVAQDCQEALEAQEHPVEDSIQKDQEGKEKGVWHHLAQDAQIAREKMPAKVGSKAAHQKEVEKGQEGCVQKACEEGSSKKGVQS